MGKEHLYFVVESASPKDLKKAEKDENFDPWDSHTYYPSIIIERVNGKLLNEETEFDLGFIRANSDVYQLSNKYKDTHYRVRKHWMPDTGFKHGEQITYEGHFEKSKSREEWRKHM